MNQRTNVERSWFETQARHIYLHDDMEADDTVTSSFVSNMVRAAYGEIDKYWTVRLVQKGGAGEHELIIPFVTILAVIRK